MNTPSYQGDAAFQSILSQIDLDKDVYSVKAFVAGYVWGLEEDFNVDSFFLPTSNN